MKRLIFVLLVGLSGSSALGQGARAPAVTTSFADVATITGKQTTFGALYYLNTDCSPFEWFEIIVVQPPKFGFFELVAKNVAASYPENNNRKVCNGKQVPAKAIAYTPMDNAPAKDIMIVDRVASDGSRARVQYNISIIRAAP